ncbi:MAG: periplasmic heavy metal sensor [Kiritimatiellia bacterium]
MNKITRGSGLVELSAVLCLSLLLAAPLSAGEGPKANQGENQRFGQKRADNEARFEAIADKLGLTDEQKGKIQALRQSQRQQMEALMEQLRNKQQQMKSELNKSGATRESIAPLVTEIKAIHAQIVDLRINNIFAIKDMLSAEQFGRMQQFHQQKTGERQACRPFWLDMKLRKKNNEENTEPEH